MTSPVSVSFSGIDTKSVLADYSTELSLSLSGSAGLSCGEWLSFGAPDLAGDQRTVAEYHACWASPVLTDHLHILGRADLVLDCQADTEQAQLYAALCHVMDSQGGGFRLLTYGLLDISGESWQQLVIGDTHNITLQALETKR